MPSDFIGRGLQYVTVNANADGGQTVIPAPGVNKAILLVGYNVRILGAGDSVISGLSDGGSVPFTGAASPGLPYSAFGSENVGVMRMATNTALTVTNAAGIDMVGTMVFRVVQAVL